MSSPLRALPERGLGQVGRDRLELLEALISGPRFDPLFRGDVLDIPPDHETYGWGCAVLECLRTRTSTSDFCSTHRKEWIDHLARDPEGATRTGFLSATQPLEPAGGARRSSARSVRTGPPTTTRDGSACSTIGCGTATPDGLEHPPTSPRGCATRSLSAGLRDMPGGDVRPYG